MLARASDDTRVGITGLGAYLPETVLGNDVIGDRLGVSSDWIVERSGILERRIAAAEETTTSLAVEAARAALDLAGCDPTTVDVVIVATGTPDALTPATAARVAASIGAAGAAAYDVSAACTGFIYGLAQAHAAIVSGLARRAVVIGAEVLSRVTDWQDPGTAILFGDGSGAAVIEPVQEGGFLGFELGCDGTRADDLMLPVGGTIHMNGAAVYRFSIREVPESAERLLERCELSVADVDLYAPHQSNMRIIDSTCRRLGLPRDKTLTNIARLGNTSAASIPLVLAEAAEQHRLEPGTTILMTGVGAGMTWGSSLLRWGSDAR